MYVKIEQSNVKSIKLHNVSGVAEFSDNDIAQVTEELGSELIARYDTITEHNNS